MIVRGGPNSLRAGVGVGGGTGGGLGGGSGWATVGMWVGSSKMMSVPAILEQLNHDGIEGEQIDDFDAIAARVARDARDGDVVIVMSSGAFGGVHEKILEALRS